MALGVIDLTDGLGVPCLAGWIGGVSTPAYAHDHPWLRVRAHSTNVFGWLRHLFSVNVSTNDADVVQIVMR